MPRKKSNAGGRRHDTRMTIKEVCRLLGINPRQRVKFLNYLKVGGHLKED